MTAAAIISEMNEFKLIENMVAHAKELMNYAVDYTETETQEMAELLKTNGTWLSPTLTTMERILSQVKSLAELKALQSLQYVHPLLQVNGLRRINTTKCQVLNKLLILSNG